jgi:endoplasmic reticulum-Golgi intermediate compartment protein 3
MSCPHDSVPRSEAQRFGCVSKGTMSSARFVVFFFFFFFLLLIRSITVPVLDRHPGEAGCRTTGHITVHKIGGNMHVAAGKSGTQSHGTHTHHMHRVNFETLHSFNISHTIHKFHFGDDFYGKVDPLNGVVAWEHELAQYQYLVSVVPTSYIRASGWVTPSHQYSYTVHREKVDVGSRSFKLPGLFIKYSFDALRMTKRDHPSSSFSHLVTRLCALLGGSYVIFGLLYRSVSNTAELLSKKQD